MNRIFFLCIYLCSSLLFGHTIAEKKESFLKSDSELDGETQGKLKEVNASLAEKKHHLKQLYQNAIKLYEAEADEESYRQLLEKINGIREEIAQIEEMWREETSSMLSNESYALWHQPDCSLAQLVVDYGTQECVYIIPPEIGNIRLSINSNLPIPRESWGDCLELILAGQGIGVRQLNPYLRELYFQRSQPAQGLKHITSELCDLDVLPASARICFVFSPEVPNPRTVLQFFQKFSNPMTTMLHVIGGDIFIIATVENVKELFKLYDFVKLGSKGQDHQLISSSKLDAAQMETILRSAFLEERGNEKTDESGWLKIIPLHNLSDTLFLSGSKEEVAKAMKLIRDVETQIENPQEKTIFWYTAKHSEAEDLAKVLAKVYDQLVGISSSGQIEEKIIQVKEGVQKEKENEPLIVSPALIGPQKKNASPPSSHKTADGQNNFIVDAKTGSIIMVVEKSALPKIKELLKKLDVPKKMVQIEVLLFEKKIASKNKFGLNLLRLGDTASKDNSTGLSWNAVGKGILEFLISRGKGSGIPAYDLAYNFLLSQDDVQINASPSVTTINQTPAEIAVVDEISIYTGADKDKNTSYCRSQYGITIQITPTINTSEIEGEEEENGYITLDTDITFDTTKKGGDDRPDVTRRHIKNHVRIADGQTVILGGLRRKMSEDSKDSIPFLGEIPGIGKLFSTTDMNDNSTEMFIFITPKILYDPLEDTERIKREELRKRPGDIPEFLHELIEAKDRERKKLFQGSLTALFGRDNLLTKTHRESLGEYDGR